MLGFLLPTQVAAGAWPRDEGEVFISLGGNVALFSSVRPVHYDPTYYVEYGVTPWLTVGLDGFHADRGAARNAFGFARIPLLQNVAGHQLAVSVAVGQLRYKGLDRDAETLPMARLALHWGYGLNDGWLAADVQTQFHLPRDGADDGPDLSQSKADLTWGYRFGGHWMMTWTLQLGYGLDHDFYAKITPAAGFELREGLSLRGSYTQALSGDRGAALGLEAWFTF
ncbi:hypothetical protein [Ketogulonicigenium robustum]|uniref:hypothetical protein n=1 Tax=Ketogulonicigenium robustum TaxID=92947 RepID=UPI001F3B6EE1|nr:hypothetical protein [Ketogulonicigenium robustum]